jgi:hypothetical protein
VQDKEKLLQGKKETSGNIDLRLNHINDGNESHIDEMLCKLELAETKHHD